MLILSASHDVFLQYCMFHLFPFSLPVPPSLPSLHLTSSTPFAFFLSLFTHLLSSLLSLSLPRCPSSGVFLERLASLFCSSSGEASLTMRGSSTSPKDRVRHRDRDRETETDTDRERERRRECERGKGIIRVTRRGVQPTPRTCSRMQPKEDGADSGVRSEKGSLRLKSHSRWMSTLSQTCPPRAEGASWTPFGGLMSSKPLGANSSSNGKVLTAAKCQPGVRGAKRHSLIPLGCSWYQHSSGIKPVHPLTAMRRGVFVWF